MSKKTATTTTATPNTATVAAPLVPILLLALSAGESLLALFQWMELLVLRAGGNTVCAVNETVNCQAVWETGFASGIHRYLGIPVAGLGLVWGLVAFGLSAAWVHALLRGRPGTAQAAALKLTALVGLVSILVFAVVSFQAGAVCLTCIATYVFVGAFALVALRMVPGGALPTGSGELKGALVWAGGFAVVAYLALLGPGIATPPARESGADMLGRLEKVGAAGADAGTSGTGTGTGSASAADNQVRPLTDAERAVASFFRELPPQEKQMVSNLAAIYQASPRAQGPLPEPRRLSGPKEAPVKLVEWVEIRCGHCKALNDTIHELQRVAPDGAFSVEARNYPLAAECNPHVQRPDPSGVSCLAAKALICLEETEDFAKVRSALFAAQQSLTTQDRVYEIASTGKMSRQKLEQCVKSDATAKKLADDIAYAMKYDPQGTPIVAINGKAASPFPPLLYALILARGDASAAPFQMLPAPRMDQLTGHEGHGH